MNTKKTFARSAAWLLAASACVAAYGCVAGPGDGDVESDESELRVSVSGPEGDSCKVTGGVNKGKTGKFDDEGWCCGDWGCTECRNQDGADNGKCSAAAKVRPWLDWPLFDVLRTQR